MKVIISHDIDHITVTEHLGDLIIPKFVIRAKIELIMGKIGISEYFRRISGLFKNNWQNLEELMDYNSGKDIPATFFIGVRKGKGLAYSAGNAEYWINRIIERGFDIGVHGIAYDDLTLIKQEYDVFKTASGLSTFGIRMHYLRKGEKTLEFISKTGYAFDASIYASENPYKIGEMWEFPLHVMDGYMLLGDKRYQSRNLDRAKDETKSGIDHLEKKGIKYLTVLFHDRYFNPGFMTWMKWYIWLIDWLKESGHSFINYRQAIKELKIK